ncbi:hypothetical protein GCM10023080_079690 [Streptomyces pseudoechinosporeus]
MSSEAAPRSGRVHPVPSPTTVRRLYGTALRCGFPECVEPLYRVSTYTGEQVLNSEVAHIHARRENGPRWDPHMSAEENRSDANLILMCQAHAKEIDDSPERFPADLLRDWKRIQLLECEETVGRPLTDAEAAQVLERSFGADQLVAVVAAVVPFSARSRSRQEALDLAGREARARRLVQLGPVPAQRREAVLAWMSQHAGPALVVSAGQVRVLVGPMGAGKSERALRWWEEGLKVAEADAEVEVPVWVPARSITSTLAAAVTDAIGGDPKRPCRVVVDDLDGVSPRQADQLLDEARRLVVVWPAMRVLATGPPGMSVAPEELLTTVPWPLERGVDLLRCVLGEEPPRAVWTPEAQELLTSPLLVLAMAARIASGRSIDVSPLQLLSGLAADIIARERPQTSEQTWERLGGLAARILASPESVPAASVGTEPEVWSLTETGLVVHDETGLRFALPVFEHHFAAQALRSGMVALEDAAGPRAFPRWRYAIAFVVSSAPGGDAEQWMLRLARTNPAAASWVLDEIDLRHPAAPHGHPGNDTDPSLGAGQWLREAAQAFLDGFGACGPHLARHDDGRLVQWGVRLRGEWMAVYEAREATKPELLRLPDEALYTGALASGWRAGTQFPFPSRPLGRWRWSRNKLREPLTRMLRLRRLPLPPRSPLADERMWVLAQQIMTIKHLRWNRIIPLPDLRAAVAEMMIQVNTSVLSRWSTGGAEIDSHDIRWIDARLHTLEGDHLAPPQPLPDRPSSTSRRRWQDYSPELAATIVTAVLQDALTGYRDLVTENFPRFGAALGLYSVLPAQAKGQVIMLEGDLDGSGLYYTLIADPGNARDAPPRVDLAFADAPHSFHDPAGPAAARSHESVFRRSSENLIDLPTGSARPATNLAYTWLANDLAAVGWLHRPLHFSD